MLRTLHIGAGCGRILPKLETPRLDSVDHSNVTGKGLIEMPYSKVDVATSLRIVEIRQARLNSTWFELAIASRQLNNLRELKISDVGDVDCRLPWVEYDFSRTNDLLVTHLPDLQVFEWSHHDYEREFSRIHPFGSFQAMSELKELTLDYELLTPYNVDYDTSKDVLRLSHLQSYLPESLIALYITGVESLGTLFSRRDGMVLFDHDTSEIFTPNLRRLDVSTFMTRWHYDEGNGADELTRYVRRFLPKVVATFAEAGVTLQVWEQRGRAGPCKLLYRPGYSASWP